MNSTPPTPSGPARPTVTPTSRTMILTGIPGDGVEGGACRLLSGYLLIGGPRDVLTSGQRVKVTGHERTGRMTTFQQGIPVVGRERGARLTCLRGSASSSRDRRQDGGNTVRSQRLS